MSFELPATMKAVVFRGPLDVQVEQKPTPRIENPTDAIVKVEYAGLCGSDMHTYRGHIKGKPGTIVGHEFTGTVVAVGADVSKFKPGDDVLSCFSIQCGECFYCQHGLTGQCVKTNTFGKPGLDGGQAEYVRVPFADHVLVKKPASSSTDDIDDSVYLLMADIFVTGYFGVKKIVDFFKMQPAQGYKTQSIEEVSVLQIGAGPVGLCALHVLKYFGFKKIVVVDSIPSRLEAAKKIGAYKTINFETEANGVADFVAQDLNGVGFDAVLEVVGAESSMKSAFDAVRGNGFISALGMGHGPFPFDALQAYLKNLNLSCGRCHGYALFPEALNIFETMKDKLTDFIDHKTSIDNAKEAFKLFDEHKVNKVAFDFRSKE
ncbi:hypothetical protein KGF57_004956 [Candida theae]|uniref:Enoyl reductase (ER) domain-containing protein n=1 Tax=Candida theae TaxID=1198502 RepID=A0AAD5BAU4_9ASCO|nr:uncharacterized protein KGF57_004956 [Candida theae]KAI5949126.1 hypothetical protein KGF57_004956 [Candida theae]